MGKLNFYQVNIFILSNKQNYIIFQEASDRINITKLHLEYDQKHKR